MNWSRFKVAKTNFLLHLDFNSFFKKNSFFSFGIDDSSHGHFKKLDDILKEYLLNKEFIFLKADIEEYEFKILDDIIRNKSRFHSIAMEIHNIHKEENGFKKFVEKLEKHFYIYHIHANNYGSIQNKGGFPNVVEISCIRRDLVTHPLFYKDFSHLPLLALDFPNNPLGADFKW